VIICAVLAVLTSRSAPTLPTRKLDRFAAGAQIITGETHRKTLPVHSNMTAPQLELVRRYVTTTLLCE
jgi:hypothetical protein